MGYYRYRKYNKAAAHLCDWVCGGLFIVFAAVYLACFQKDLIEAMHYSMANGKTEFKIIPATIIIITILLIMKWGLNLLMRLRGRVCALSYLPSFLGLVTMTGFGRDIYAGSNSYTWLWLMPIIIVVYVGIVVAARKLFGNPYYSNTNTMGMVISNISLMIVMCISTLCLGNTNKYLHNELRMENLMRRNKYDEVLMVAAKSDKATRTMTALRMMAMSKEGKTGEMLFKYPQNFKSEGMFFSSDPTKTVRYTNDSIYAFLGEKPHEGENRMAYLKRLAYENDSCQNARLYYLAGLILDKDIDEFATAIDNFGIKGDSLQKYFKEAALLYKEKNPLWNFEIQDKDSICHKQMERYKYRQMDTYKSGNEERNKMEMEFGDTFRWYYDYKK